MRITSRAQMRPAEYWVVDGRVEKIRRGETLQDHLDLFDV